jgi:hypothetical protein
MSDDIKVPRRSNQSRVERALTKTPQDGDWHKLLDMGLTTAEQTARSYNVPGGAWELGYRHSANNGEIRSELWARWVG